jgi:hypothetical protein
MDLMDLKPTSDTVDVFAEASHYILNHLNK